MPPRLCPRAAAAGRGDSGAGQTHHYLRAAHRGPPARKRLRQVPSGVELGEVVGAGGGAGVAHPTRGRLCRHGAGAGGPRRNAGAALGGADRRARHLPRCGAQQQGAGGEMQRLALDQRRVADAHSVGGAGVGAALSDGVGAFRALGAAAQAAPQNRL